MRLKKEYALGLLVVGIIVLYFLINTTEGFASKGLIQSKEIPNSQVESIYLLVKSLSNIKIVTLTKPSTIIKDIKLSSNMLIVTLHSAHTIQDFAAYGFSKNKWNVGDFDGGLTTLSLLEPESKDAKQLKRKSFTGGILNGKKLPQKLTTFRLGPITTGGFPALDLNGDPAMDSGKVKALSNVRIELLLTK